MPEGGTKKIITYLSFRNFDLSKIDAYILLFIGHPQAGWIDIGSNVLSKYDFLYRLTKAKAAMTNITLIPGETSEYFFASAAKNLNLDYNKLIYEFYKMSPFKEGFLVPETYKIPIGISEKHLVYYLINLSRVKNKALSKKIFGLWDENKWKEYLIVASIIQKEAANQKEMPIVSSVIYNRLKKGMKLQMDGTLNYGLHSHEKITPQRIQNDKSKFNTYKYFGLPNEPVCNPSFEAILAAIFPKKTNYLYFVRDKASGAHIFSSSLNAHNRAIKKSNLSR